MTALATGLVILASILLLLGPALMLIAALGILRMPDLFMRMQAASKAGVLGAGLTVLGVATYYGEPAVTARALAIIGFAALTTPIAAHMIGRAAYFVGVPLWEKSVRDDLRGHYDPQTHALDSDHD